MSVAGKVTCCSCGARTTLEPLMGRAGSRESQEK